MEIQAASLDIARAHLSEADPALATRTWRYVIDELIKTKHGENRVRWERAKKDRALKAILDQPLIVTRAEHFLAAIHGG